MSARGERNSHAKLTCDTVRLLRQMHAAGAGIPLPLLAVAFEITARQVGLIVTGQRWAAVGGPVRPVYPHRVTRTSMGLCPTDGTELASATDGNGYARTWCPGCERRRRGRCLDCGTSVRGRAWRCPWHLKARKRQARLETDRRCREALNRRNREYRRARRRAELATIGVRELAA